MIIVLYIFLIISYLVLFESALIVGHESGDSKASAFFLCLFMTPIITMFYYMALNTAKIGKNNEKMD